MYVANILFGFVIVIAITSIFSFVITSRDYDDSMLPVRLLAVQTSATVIATSIVVAGLFNVRYDVK